MSEWRAIADQLASALEAVQEGWLYLTAMNAKDCPESIRTSASEKFCTALDQRRAALNAYKAAQGAVSGKDTPKDG